MDGWSWDRRATTVLYVSGMVRGEPEGVSLLQAAGYTVLQCMNIHARCRASHNPVYSDLDDDDADEKSRLAK